MKDDIASTVPGAEPNGRFSRFLYAEWRRFWSVGHAIGLFVGMLGIVLPGLLFVSGGQRHFEGSEESDRPVRPLGPGGEAVNDRFFFVHQPLDGDGSVTVRLTSMTGIITYPPPNHDKIIPGVVPWAKAGVMIKNSVDQGAAYAAVMVTGSHGVRMQYNFVEDRAGSPAGVSPQSPRWLRLTRSGDTLTGFESTDGLKWSEVSRARLDGLGPTVEAGIFAASPSDVTVSEGAARFTNVTAVFDHFVLEGRAPAGAWKATDVGASKRLPPHLGGKLVESGGAFTLTGAGDIAPRGFPDGQPIENSLIGAWIAAIAFIVVGVTFFTSEYRRRLTGSGKTDANRPANQVLAAKTIVVAAVTFTAGLIGVATSVTLGKRMLRAGEDLLLPVTFLTELRVVIGTAATLALIAVLGLALGALLRRGWLAVLTAIVLVVLPLIVAVALVLPGGSSHWEMRLAVSQWLLRVTPAAGLAIRQSIPAYPQVLGPYTPMMGYYPLSPWTGFAVLCAETAIVLGLASFLLRKRVL